MKNEKYAFSLQITNNEIHEDVDNSFMTDDLDVVIKELKQIIIDLETLKRENVF